MKLSRRFIVFLVVWGIIVVAVVVVLSWRYVEQPFLRLKDALGKPRRNAVSAATTQS